MQRLGSSSCCSAHGRRRLTEGRCKTGDRYSALSTDSSAPTQACRPCGDVPADLTDVAGEAVRSAIQAGFDAHHPRRSPGRGKL